MIRAGDLMARVVERAGEAMDAEQRAAAAVSAIEDARTLPVDPATHKALRKASARLRAVIEGRRCD